MSRRESRVSLNAGQNDALFEFEKFKKKYLMANKCITKLNSTLSVRIEELNAQISTLYTENLRLRASEISLATELKREREKSRRVIAEAESAAENFAKHLGLLRNTFSITRENTPSPTPSPPRVIQRPRAPSPTSPEAAARLVRPPNFPDIHEEDEPIDDERHPTKISPRRKSRATKIPRMSIPEPPRPTSAPDSPIHIDFVMNSVNRRKSVRRQSGILVMSQNQEALKMERPVSPVLGSPARVEAELGDDEDEDAHAPLDLGDGDVEIDEVEIAPPRKGKTTSDTSSRRIAKAEEHDDEAVRKERKKAKALADREAACSTTESEPATRKVKSKLKDVTNSPRLSPALPPDDTDIASVPSTARSLSPALPTPRPSSPSPSPEADADGGRERRVRKSVNYAEPKLNTKMRKPGPDPVAKRKRASAAAVMSTAKTDMATVTSVRVEEPRSSTELPSRKSKEIDPALFPLPPSRPGSALSSSPKREHRRRPSYDEDDDDDDGVDADGEYVPPRGAISGWVNVDGRRRRRGIESDERRHSIAV